MDLIGPYQNDFITVTFKKEARKAGLYISFSLRFVA